MLWLWHSICVLRGFTFNERRLDDILKLSYYPQLKYDLILYFLTFPYDEQESSKFASRPSCALLA